MLITGLKMKPKTIRLLEENIEEKLSELKFGNDWLDITPNAQAAKAQIAKWDNSKLKNFCTWKETTEWKATYTLGENICNSKNVL